MLPVFLRRSVAESLETADKAFTTPSCTPDDSDLYWVFISFEFYIVIEAKGNDQHITHFLSQKHRQQKYVRMIHSLLEAMISSSLVVITDICDAHCSSFCFLSHSLHSDTMGCFLFPGSDFKWSLATGNRVWLWNRYVLFPSSVYRCDLFFFRLVILLPVYTSRCSLNHNTPKERERKAH